MAGPRSLNLLDLPEETLLACLALLPLHKRLSAACFVCKRFRELCLAPELLRSMQLGAWGPTALPYGQSLQHFLEQHAQHVRRLALHLQLQYPHLGHPLPYAQHLHDELAAAVAGCLAASAAASRGGPGLEELVLSPATDLTRAGTRQWLPRLPRLQVLWMGREEDALTLPAAISRLTALRELGLRGQEFIGCNSVRLPASLTRLQVSGEGGTELLRHQLTRLTNLLVLEAVRCAWDCDAAWGGITVLTGLQALQLEECEPVLPSWLPALTQLRQLAISGDPAIDEEDDFEAEPPEVLGAARLQATHAPLQQLTSLVLKSADMASLPPALAQQPLHRLLLHTVFGPEAFPCPCPLLASLRWLALQWQVARNNLHVLAAASQLEHFCLAEIPVSRVPPREEALWQQFWEWAATHPPLRCLSLEANPEDKTALVLQLASLVELGRRRPELRIRSTVPPASDLGWCRSSESDTNFFYAWDELFAWDHAHA